MELRYSGQLLYSSTFDEKTGSIVRVVERATDRYNDVTRNLPKDEAFEQKYFRAKSMGLHTAFSPVPELLDISITDKCVMGCSYCYQDSTPDKAHAPKELVETVLKGFDQPPYQIAIGGGEPTLHPDLPYILRKCRELGTVPNYTTAGDKLSTRVVEATNEFCGGVAMTFHAFKGLDWFVEHYNRLRDRLRVQVNVHLIADKDVAKNLTALVDQHKNIGPLNLVLLAYYPDVGRASLDSLITKHVYMKHLPEAIKAAQSTGHKIAFSEGLLPYFLSRPQLGVNTDFAMRSEGIFACYINPKGQMTQSSFQAPWSRDGEEPETVYTHTSQELWGKLSSWNGTPNGESCYGCVHERRCSTPHDFHYLLCDFAMHNKLPLTETPTKPKTVYEHLLESEE
jgi:hypothetical protein